MQRALAVVVSLLLVAPACTPPADPVAPGGASPTASSEPVAPGSASPAGSHAPMAAADTMRAPPMAASAAPASAPAATAPAVVKYYVLLAKNVRHATGRPQPEIEALVLGALRGKIQTAGEIELRNIDDPAGKTKLDKRAMRLTASIDPITFAKGDWAVSVVLRVERHSDGALLGEVKKRVLVAGADKPSTQRDDYQIRAAMEAAAQDFVGRCAAFEEASFKMKPSK